MILQKHMPKYHLFTLSTQAHTNIEHTSEVIWCEIENAAQCTEEKTHRAGFFLRDCVKKIQQHEFNWYTDWLTHLFSDLF